MAQSLGAIADAQTALNATYVGGGPSQEIRNQAYSTLGIPTFPINAPVTPTIQAGSLGSISTPYNLPNNAPSTLAEGLSATSLAQGEQVKLQQEADAKAQEAQNTVNTEKQALQGTMDEYLGVQNSQAGLETQYKLPEKNLALTDATNKLEASQRAQTNELRALEASGLGEVQIGQKQREINRRYAFEQADLALIQSAANRDVATAQSIVDRKIQLQMEPLKTKLDFAKFIYEQDRADNTAAQNKAMDLKIKQFDRQYQKEEDNLKQIGQIQLELAKNGAPSNVITKVGQSRTPLDALAAGAGYFQSPLEKAQTAKIYADIAATGTPNPIETLAYAQQYASTGMIPTGMPKGTFGTVSQVAKELPKPAGTLVDMNTGIKSGKLSGAQNDGIIALKDLSNKLTEAETLFKDLNTGILAGTKNAVFPSQKQQEYDALRSEIVDLLARARTGAAINASEEALYLGKVPGKLNNTLFIGSTGENKLGGLKSSIEGKLNTTLQTNGLSIYGYSKVKVGDNEYTVGDVVSNDNGKTSYRVNPDGSLTEI